MRFLRGGVITDNETRARAMLLVRSELGLSQEALGDLLDVTRRSVGRWERGSRPTPRWVPYALAGILASTGKVHEALDLLHRQEDLFEGADLEASRRELRG